MIHQILPLVECKSTNGRVNSTDGRPNWVKNTLTKYDEHCIIYSVQGNHTEPVLPAVTGSGKVVSMYPRIDFYRIEAFYNTDQTIDAFLYARIPEDSTYRAKNYGSDDRWDLSGAKLDLLADGITLRKLLSAIAVDPMHCFSVRQHLGFTGVGDCPALDDVAHADYVDSEKIVDIFFDDGAFPVIRTILAGRVARDHDIIRQFILG